MKKLISILLVLSSVISFGQSVVQRATGGNTVADARLMVQTNLFIPRYTDTTQANLVGNPNNLGVDSIGAIIFTYDVNNFWVRVRGGGGSKRWQQGSGGGTVLPDGVYSGGQVAYSGSGYIYIVSAATYVLNGVIYNSPQDSIELEPADLTFDRIDVIGLSNSGGADKITGEPSANPQEPSVNPQTFIRRSIVTVVANTTQPPNIDQTVIFDEGAGEPTEWTPASEGNTDFLDVQNPYHLTIDALTVAINPNQRIYFINNDTINSVGRSSLVIFTSLLQPLLPSQNINVQLRYQGNPVSILLPLTKYGLLVNLTNKYQMSAIPFTEFGAGNIIFDEVDLIPTGDSPFPFFYNDYIQIQSGLSTIFSQQNAYTYIMDVNGTVLTATSPNSGFNVEGINGIFSYVNPSTNAIVNDGIALTLQQAIINSGLLNQDNVIVGQSNQIDWQDFSVFQIENPAITFRLRLDNNAILNQYINGNNIAESGVFFFDQSAAILASADGGMTNNQFRALPDSISIHGLLDGTGDGSTAYLTGIDASNNWVKIPIGDVSSVVSLSNIGSGYRWAIPGGLNVKTAFPANGILIDSSSNSNGLTFQIDSSKYTTKYKFDSLKNVVSSFGTASNIGAGYRLVIPFTNQIKTLFADITGTWDSTSNTNGLTYKVDTTQVATRAYVNNVAGGGGFTGVTSVSVVTANGLAGTVATATSTPAITLRTTVTGLLKGNGTAISAAVAGTDYLTPTGSAAALTSFPTFNQNTTGTASNVTGTVLVANGGTGRTTNTAYALMAAGTTATGAMQQVSGVGTAGQVLTSNGTAALPTWQNAATGVSSLTGAANRVTVSASTGAITISAPQDIATTSSVTFQRGTFTGAAATANLILNSHTDPTAAAGVLTNNGTRLAFSLATTYKRFIFSNDVTPTAGQGLFGNGTDFTVGTYSAANNSIVVTPSGTGVTYRTNSTVQTLSGTSVTLNAANGWNGQWTLSASGSSLAISNPVAGATYFVNAVQDGTGSRTITTYPSGTVWYSGSAPTLKTTPGAVNTLAFYYNGSNYYGYDWGSGGGSGFANPMTTLGDVIYGGASGVATRLAGNITVNPRVLTSTGTGTTATAPVFTDVIVSYASSATLDFGSIPAQSRLELTLPVANAAVGDAVIVGTTVNQTNVIFTGRVSAAGVVSVQANNFGTAAQNPASGTFKVTVVK